MRRVALFALLAAATLPAPARASTISSAAGAVSLAALPGEANHVQVLPARDGGVDIRDSVHLTTGTGCVATSATSAHCPGPIIGVNMDLGDGDDELTADPLAEVALVISGNAGNDTITAGRLADLVDGGPGNDTIHGGEAADRLLGGPGRDTLDGGAGEDTLDGGDGDDVLLGDGAANPARTGADALDGGAGDDLLEGGPRGDSTTGGDGRDTVTYADHATAVTVTLDGAPGDGEDGERDDLAGDIEDVLGGPGADVIIGSAGPNALSGGAGDDTIAGGGGIDQLAGEAGDDVLRGGGGEDPDDGDTLDGGDGRDRLTGDAGLDVLRAGAGDDVVDSREPPNISAPGEVVDCGEGSDVARHDLADSLISCEDALRDVAPPPPERAMPELATSAAAPPRGAGSQPPLGVPVVVKGAVVLPVICPAVAGPACLVTATLVASPPRAKRRRKGRGRVIGRVAVTVPAGRRATVTVPLSRSGARYVRRVRRTRALAQVTLRPDGGPARRWARPLLLSGTALGF